MARLLFVLPRSSWTPIGALKVVYSYCDSLADAGHDVLVVHGRQEGAPAADPHPWHVSRLGVRSLVVPGLDQRRIGGNYDVVVATSWQVVPTVEKYSARFGRKAAFFQDCESYHLGSATEKMAIERSARTGWPTIAGSEPVRRLLESLGGGRCTVVACGVDTERFRVHVPIGDASRSLIGFPARDELAKRTGDAVAAIAAVRSEREEQVAVWCFGRYQGEPMPTWVDHRVRPDDDELVDLYNRTAVFVVPSELEGFGFAGAEAMACGAALVSTANGGVSAYARHGESGWLCPPRDPESLALAVTHLLDNDELRRQLALSGVTSVTSRTSHDAQTEFLQVLTEAAGL